MSNDADTLNALGLNLEGVGTEVGAQDVAAAAEAVAAEKKKRQRVTLGEISAEEDITDIPEVTRGNFGPRSTEPSALQKQFNDTGAPYQNDAGKTAYRNFKVEFPGGDDEAWGAFYRSVQGVKNQTNKANKEAGNAVYFIARSLEKDGKKYVLVIRTDARPADEPAGE